MKLVKIDDLLKAVGEENGELWTVKGIKTMIDSLPTYTREELRCGRCSPSVQPEQQWIPCSERLPEEYGEYRITWTTSASKNRLIGDAEYEVTGEWDEVNGRFKGEWLLDEYIKNYPNVKVLAWKPLEEPWKGEQP